VFASHGGLFGLAAMVSVTVPAFTSAALGVYTGFKIVVDDH
jgi:hypothetical protein